MNKKALTERDICTKFITPGLVQARWDVLDQIREQVYLTKGKVVVRGKLVARGNPKFADYVLFHKPNLPIAVIEAKDNNHSVGAGMQQALEYAEMLDVPFVYSSNGDGFLEHDRTGGTQVVERDLGMGAFPGPDELWLSYCKWKGLTPAAEALVEQPFFTIIDFRKATELFADPDFDGLPVQIYSPKDDQSPAPPDEEQTPEEIAALDKAAVLGKVAESFGDGKGGGKRVKYIVGDVPVHVVAERVQYYGKDGKLVSESLKDYTRRAIRERFDSLDSFLKTWNSSDQKAVILHELEQHGVFFQELALEVGKDFGAFDLICHVAFDKPPLTRRERANNVRKRNYFTKYGDACRAVLEALLEKFSDEGVDDIEDINVLKVSPVASLGTPVELVGRFGGKQPYQKAVQELEDELYKVS